MQFLAKVIALAVFQHQITGAASTASFLPSNFALWFWQCSIVVQNWLYIDGGEIWARWNGPSNNASSVWNQQTIAIDLSSSWDTTLLAATVIVSKKTTALSPTRQPDLYYNPKEGIIYALGGDAYELNGGIYNTSVPVQLWGFKPDSGHANWELQEVGPTQSFPLTSNVVGGLTATSPTGHYNLGGYISFGPDDSVGQLALTDNFEPALPLGPSPVHSYFGQDGVILFFGGKWPSDNSVGDTSSVSRLDTILVYDIRNDKFFKQPATNAPVGRFSLCSVAVGANSSANSSYEIFIYGGTTGSVPDDATKAELSTVYILTLPAFNWLPAPVKAPTWRASHTCSIIGNRQMVSIAGTQDGDNRATWTDPWTNSFGIFDLTTLNWTNKYDHTAAPYEPPSLVTNYYASNPRYPISWADPALQGIFQANATTTGAAGTSTAISSPGTSSTGAIAGGVVGGIAGIAIVGGAIFWIWRKRRQSRRSTRGEMKGPVEMDSNLKPRADLPMKASSPTAPAAIYEVQGSRPAVYEMPSGG